MILPVLVNLISPSPSKIFGEFTDGSVVHRFRPYMTTTIRKKQNFVILCGIDLHSLDENDIEKWSSEHLFRAASKTFLWTGKSKYFRGGELS